MDEFKRRYNNLNAKQRQAVDQIEGPLMVVAGPGTGKTELLSVRTANILYKTDVLPENILCLTYTESGVKAIRERLIGILGRDAYKVAVHTFHSFGNEIINQNSEFFYHGANYFPVDPLRKIEILEQILKNLGPRDPLSSKKNGEFVWLKSIETAIADIKKSSLTVSEIINILDQNNLAIEKINQIFSVIFKERLSNNSISKISDALSKIEVIGDKPSLKLILPLSEVFIASAEDALAQAQSIEKGAKTPPIKRWRDKWFELNQNRNYVLKSQKKQLRLRSLVNVYEQYIEQMDSLALYDYDDMILEVVHAMEVYDDLRYNLQEKYQYIMVDEFQDTNLVQLRILQNLTNNHVQDDTPNLMIVGDDDQAIYSFQGAELSNILTFQKHYPKAYPPITLNYNYRSIPTILSGAYEIISQGVERLENSVNEIDKKLISKSNQQNGEVFIHEAKSQLDERQWLVSDIKKRIASGANPTEIAVLVRNHKDIKSLLPYFTEAHISVSYERQDDVLQLEPIILLEKLTQILLDISDGKHNEVNAELPEVLAHPMWKLQPNVLWQASLRAYDKYQRWLEVMDDDETLSKIKNWLIKTSLEIKNLPIESALDVIIGNPRIVDKNSFVSPFYEYFFAEDIMSNNPSKYLSYLDGLVALRSRLREYQTNNSFGLRDFIRFISLNRQHNKPIRSHRQFSSSTNAINVMTAHSSKGLEFDTVYVANAIDSSWGTSTRGQNNTKITYPENLQIGIAGETSDEKLRLFYVAVTRARNQLYLSYSQKNDRNKSALPVSFITSIQWENKKIESREDPRDELKTIETAWYENLVQPHDTNLKQLLKPILDDYQLSPTHLNSFVDLQYGGPQKFLLEHLLRFPSAKTPSSAYGTAVHNTIRNAHEHIIAQHKPQAIEDILGVFEKNLERERLEKKDFQTFLKSGIETLRIFLDEKYSSFNSEQKVELDFKKQSVVVGDARLTGKLDLVDINKKNKTITVTDYKTGKPYYEWTKDSRLHKYHQQLLFYKLLVENSRDYHNLEVKGCLVQFVEPDENNQILNLNSDFSKEEIEHFEKLIDAVWKHIINLDLPDVSNYSKDIKGTLAFEQDLIEGKI